MHIYEVGALQPQHDLDAVNWHEFLRVPALSAGMYTLPAGAPDPQQPHSEDEVYFVVSGTGRIAVGEEDEQVQAGSIVYVPAHVAHRFHSITNALSVLVFFAPAEYTNAAPA